MRETRTADETEDELLRWVRANTQVPAEMIDQQSPLIGEVSVLDSLALVSLTYLIEDLRGEPIHPDDFADLGRFATVATIMAAYFRDVA